MRKQTRNGGLYYTYKMQFLPHKTTSFRDYFLLFKITKISKGVYMFILLFLSLLKTKADLHVLRLHFFTSMLFCHRYDRKNLGCFWDRQHPSPYFYVALGTIVALLTFIIIYCYYQIFLYTKMCKKMVS